MKVLIVEDEKHNASRLQRLLADISPDFIVLGVLETVRESINWLKKEVTPDVILMDIRLSDGLSFEIFEKVDVICPIIFTTSYDEYAVRAFKVNGIAYLLKPIEKDELEIALKKADREKQKNATSLELEQLLHLFKERAPVFRKRFLLPGYNGYKTISVEEIDYFYTEQKISYLVTKGGNSEMLAQTMNELEDELDPDEFFRANRQYIFHIDCVKMIHNDSNGKLKVIIKHKQTADIIVSREKAPLLKKWLDR